MSKRVQCLLILASISFIAADSPAWIGDPKKMKIPEGMPSGTVGGKPFKADKASYNPTVKTLNLRQGSGFLADEEVIVFLFLKKDESIEGKTWSIAADGKFDQSRPHIHLVWKDDGKNKGGRTAFTDKYALKLEFGMAGTDGKVPGKIYLSGGDEKKSVVAGTFEVELKK
jgi:hypothetical protein